MCTTIQLRLRVLTYLVFLYAHDHLVKTCVPLPFIITSEQDHSTKIVKVLIYIFISFVFDHSTKIRGHSYSLIYLLTNCANISYATFMAVLIYFVNCTHSGTALIFRTLYPWLYEVYAHFLSWFFFSCMRVYACAHLVTLLISSFLRLLTYYLSLLCLLFILFRYWFYTWQEQPSKGALRKRCSENIQQIYRTTPMSKFDFDKVALQLYWNSLQNGCSPVNILHNFRTLLSKNTSGGLLLRLPP